MTPDDTTLAYQLLQIVEKSAAHAGKLGNLQSWATDELMKMNAKLRDEAQAKVKADQAKADQDAAAQAPPKDPRVPPQRPPGPNDDHKVDPNFGAPRASPYPPQGPRPEAPRTAPTEPPADVPDRRV